MTLPWYDTTGKGVSPFTCIQPPFIIVKTMIQQKAGIESNNFFIETWFSYLLIILFSRNKTTSNIFRFIQLLFQKSGSFVPSIIFIVNRQSICLLNAMEYGTVWVAYRGMVS
jgi:hypothetical protein